MRIVAVRLGLFLLTLAGLLSVWPGQQRFGWLLVFAGASGQAIFSVWERVVTFRRRPVRSAQVSVGALGEWVASDASRLQDPGRSAGTHRKTKGPGPGISAGPRP